MGIGRPNQLQDAVAQRFGILIRFVIGEQSPNRDLQFLRDLRKYINRRRDAPRLHACDVVSLREGNTPTSSHSFLPNSFTAVLAVKGSLRRKVRALDRSGPLSNTSPLWKERDLMEQPRGTVRLRFAPSSPSCLFASSFRERNAVFGGSDTPHNRFLQ